MPKGGATFYFYRAVPAEGEDNVSTGYYYVEKIEQEGEYEFHHKDRIKGSFTVSSEDKYPITGFTYDHGTENGKTYNGAEFYYNRNSYDITLLYADGTDINTLTYKYQQTVAEAVTPPGEPAERSEGAKEN